MLARAILMDAGAFDVTLDGPGRVKVTLASTGASVTFDLPVDESSKAAVLRMHDPAELCAQRFE
jgi:hypothetical protein